MNKETINEEMFKEQCRRDTQEIIENFTFKEYVRIAFVPLVLTHLAFHYTDKYRRYAADNRISILVKLGRAYDNLRQAYFNDLAKDLDYMNRKQILSETNRFMEVNAHDFTILWFTVNQEFKTEMPDYPYSDMRTDAVCGMLMADLFHEQNKEIDKLIQARLGKYKGSVHDPKIDALHDILDAYAGEVGKFKFTDNNISLAKKIILKRVNEIEFVIDNNNN